jgi:hypothetical protein
VPTLTIFFLRKLKNVGGQFFAALAIRAMVVRPLKYRGHYNVKWQWIRRRVVSKSAGSGEPDFTSMVLSQSPSHNTVPLNAVLGKKKLQNQRQFVPPRQDMKLHVEGLNRKLGP